MKKSKLADELEIGRNEKEEKKEENNKQIKQKNNFLSENQN